MNEQFPYYGESMAILAAIIFSWTSVFFTTAGQRLGVTLVNLLRLPLAALCLALTRLVLTGEFWPQDLTMYQYLWIGLSGIVGLAIGDSALFQAFTTIGPRRSMTMMALAPVFTVMVAWTILDEQLGWMALLGITVIISGVMLASFGRGKGQGRFGTLPKKTLRMGLFLALVAAIGQGLGTVFAKMGMISSAGQTAGCDPLSATLVRLVAATIIYWIAVLPRQNVPALVHRLKDRKGTLALAVAIVMGPFLSVWVSLVAIKNADTGIAQVLLGMVPIFVIIPSWLVYRDRPTPVSLIGVCLAVSGGALLFIR